MDHRCTECNLGKHGAQKNYGTAQLTAACVDLRVMTSDSGDEALENGSDKNN